MKLSFGLQFLSHIFRIIQNPQKEKWIIMTFEFGGEWNIFYVVRQRGYFGNFTKWVGPQTAFTLCNSAAKHVKIFKEVNTFWLFSHLKHLTCVALRLLAIITTKTRLRYQDSATLFNNFIHLLVLFCRNKIKGGSFALVTVALRVKTEEESHKTQRHREKDKA